MEVAQREILIALLVASLLLASISGDIIVQPGYERKSSIVGNPNTNYPGEPMVQPGYERESSIVGNPQINYPREPVVQPGYGQSSFSSVNPRFNPTGNNFVEPGFGQQYCRAVPATPGYSAMNLQRQAAAATLNDEIRRNQNLQQLLASQLYWIKNPVQSEQIQQIARQAVASPFIQRPLPMPHYFGFNQHYPTPRVLPGFNNGQYEWDGSPVLSRAVSPHQNFADKILYTRSVDDESGTDTGLDELHEVAADPPVERSNASKVVNLPVTDVATVEDSKAEKLVGTRRVGMPDDYAVGSPLDRVRLEHYENQQQRYPIVSTSMTSPTVVTANTEQQKILDNTASTVAGLEYGKQRQNSGYTPITTARSSQSPNPYSIDQRYLSLSTSVPGLSGITRIGHPNTASYRQVTTINDSQSGSQSSSQSGNQLGYQPGYQSGSQLGYQSGSQPGYQSSYQSDYQSGHQPGNHPGYQSIFQSSYQPGYQSHYPSNYQFSGIQPGLQNGYNSGNRPGYQSTVHVGSQPGLQAGKLPIIQIGNMPGLQIGHMPSVQIGYQSGYLDQNGHPLIAESSFGNQYHNPDSYQRSRTVGSPMVYGPTTRLVDQYGRALLSPLSSTVITRFVDPSTFFKKLYESQLARAY